MADMMMFPKKFEDFIKDYEFKDDKEVYTNGAELIPSFRVMQAWEHYTNPIDYINYRLDEIKIQSMAQGDSPVYTIDNVKELINNLYDTWRDNNEI